MDGLRKCFEDEFSEIYIFNLRGNAELKAKLEKKNLEMFLAVEVVRLLPFLF